MVEVHFQGPEKTTRFIYGILQSTIISRLASRSYDRKKGPQIKIKDKKKLFYLAAGWAVVRVACYISVSSFIS